MDKFRGFWLQEIKVDHSQTSCPREYGSAIGFASKLIEKLDVRLQTKKEYLYRVKAFIQFISVRGISLDALRDFKSYLAEKKDYSISTKNKYLVVAKILLKQMFRYQLIQYDISETASLFEQNKKHKRFGFNQREIDLLSEEIGKSPHDNRGLRLRTMFVFLVLQGLRLVELTRLDIEDLDFVNGIAMVQGKGSDDKEVVYLHPTVIKVVIEYIKSNKIKSGALFRGLGSRGDGRITTFTIRRELKQITDRLGIKKTVHGFRHYYITTLLNNLDLRDVRKFSRHRNVEMLIVYDDELDIKAKSQQVFSCFEGFSF